MRKKRIGLLFGMEDTFPWALINAINSKNSLSPRYRSHAKTMLL